MTNRGLLVTFVLMSAASGAAAQPAPPTPPAMPETTPPDSPPAPAPYAPIGAGNEAPPSAYPTTVVAPQPAPMQAPPTESVERGVMDDANSDRSLIAPSALTPPAGTFTFTDYELFWITGSYSPTDNLQITLGTALPLVSDQPFVGTLGAKLQIVKSDRLRLALHGTVGGGAESGSGGGAGIVGGALTYCLDDGCVSHLNGYLGAGFAFEDSAASPIVASAAGIFRLSNQLRGLIEVDTGYIAGDFASTSNSFLFNYALRFTGRNVGVDFGFMKLFVDGEDVLDEVPLGIPFVSFTYRGGSQF